MKVNDKELEKWLKILGGKKMVDLYVESKIYLTQKQLDRVIEFKNIQTNYKTKEN